jgi:heme O synthase-like polyprenyltransferase
MVFFFEGLRFAKSTVAAQAENDSAAVNKRARRLFFTSLAYLPVIFLILLLFKS